jgi:DNA ligase-1
MNYSELVELYQKLESTSKRLEKTEYISEFLKSSKEPYILICLLQGQVFPNWDQRKLGVSTQLVVKALSSSLGIDKERVIKEWKKQGDLGKVAEILVKEKNQSTLFQKRLTLNKVYENLRKLAEFEGEGTVNKKIALISELLTSATPLEARFITGTVLETLRVGIAEGIIRDAISKSFDVEVEKVESAFELTADYGEIADLLKKDGKEALAHLKLEPLKPLKSMLALKVDSIKEAFEELGTPCQFEYKLDGFRVQIHKNKDQIKLFTRNLEDVTNAFKELIPIIKEQIKGYSFILDAELVGYDPKTIQYLPFQKISQRIKRKYDLESMAKKFPVEITVFDIMLLNGKNLTKEELKERRRILEQIIKEKEKKIILTKLLTTDNLEKAQKFYDQALADGKEGVIAKKLDSIYQPGRYVNGWMKLKPVMDNLDLVIVEAEWGEGKRSKWLSSFTLACKDENNFLTIGKVGTGIKEKNEGLSFKDLTKMIKPLIIKEEDKHVFIKPNIIIEISYEEIQKSPTYSSGFALRFPRLIRLRTGDKGLNDVDTLQKIKRLYMTQKV